MAESSYVSPDPEIQLSINHDAGQGDLSPAPKQDLRPSDTPVPNVAPEMYQTPTVPDFDMIPPFRRQLVHPIGDLNPAAVGMSPVEKPESYDGKLDWDEYISHFRDCADLGRWPDRTKLLFLAASLRRQARTYYMGLSAEDKGTFQTLCGKLNKRMGSSKNQNRWLSKLEMRKRLPSESIATLWDDIRQMAQRAYHNLDALAQEALALNQLYKVVSLEMKCRCIDKDCQTIAEAVDVIERYESILGSDENKNKSKVRMVGNNSKSKRPAKEQVPERMAEPDNLNATLKALMSRLERLENNENNGPRDPPPQRLPQNRTCFICNSPDHFMKKCPLREQYQGQRLPFYNYGSKTNQGNSRPLTQ